MKQRFALTLETINADTRPAVVRLRGLLKVALRGFGLKCVDANEIQAAPLEKKVKAPRRKKHSGRSE